jgi:hypothetical protein
MRDPAFAAYLAEDPRHTATSWLAHRAEQARKQVRGRRAQEAKAAAEQRRQRRNAEQRRKRAARRAGIAIERVSTGTKRTRPKPVDDARAENF